MSLFGKSSYRGPLEVAFDLKNSPEFLNFPEDVKNLVYGGAVRIKNKYFNSYLKLSTSTDWSGDRMMWGGNPNKPPEADERPDRFLWHIYQVQESQGLSKCFIIQNARYGQCVKAGYKPGSDGDRETYGNNVDKGIDKDDGKERFFFRIERIGDKVYTVTNERFGGSPWKLGWGEDGDGDRKLFCSDSQKGIEDSSPERFHWCLEPAVFTF